MTARDILAQWTDESIERIEAHAKSIGGEKPELKDAAERVRHPRGPDGVAAPDLEHGQVFRLMALADLLEAADEVTPGDKADPLEEKTVPELRQLANEEGVEGAVSQMKKSDLVDAINAKRSQEEA